MLYKSVITPLKKIMETSEQRSKRYEQMSAIQAEKKANRRKALRRSRLDPYQAEIEDFIAQGFGVTDIATWLAKHKRVRVDPTTIAYRLKVWAKHAESPA